MRTIIPKSIPGTGGSAVKSLVSCYFLNVNAQGTTLLKNQQSAVYFSFLSLCVATLTRESPDICRGVFRISEIVHCLDVCGLHCWVRGTDADLLELEGTVFLAIGKSNLWKGVCFFAVYCLGLNGLWKIMKGQVRRIVLKDIHSHLIFLTIFFLCPFFF